MSFDEIYDEMLHDEFRPSAPVAPAGGADALQAAPTGLARYRTTALVASGGMACAAVGAFLGGLGGEFGLNTAGAQALHSSTTNIPGASVSSAAFKVPVIAVPTALAAPVGGVTSIVKGSALGTTHIGTGAGTLHGTTAADDTSSGPAAGTSTPASTVAAVVPKPALTQALGDISLGLNGVLTNLTSALTGLVSTVGNPSAGLGDVVTPLTGVLTDITSTISDLGSLIPLPTSTLPVLAAAAPVTNTPAAVTHTAAGAPTTSSPVSGISSVLAPLTGGGSASGGSSGQGLPALPSLPTLPVVSSLPSLPIVSTVTSLLPSLPALPLPTTSAAGSATPTCVATPATGSGLPTLVNGTVNLGVVSVGVKVGGSSAATVCIGS